MAAEPGRWAALRSDWTLVAGQPAPGIRRDSCGVCGIPWPSCWIDRPGRPPRSMAADYSPKDLLKFRPTQPGVDYDTPADAAAIDACKVELVTDAQKRTVGYALRDGQGKLLRRFIITNGGKYLNQWSYYQDGFEVYRENDLDGDRSLDECRWLNSGGTRDRGGQGGQDRRLEAALGRGGLEGHGAGPGHRRRRPARLADGHPRRAGRGRRAQGGDRQGHRPRGQAGRGGRGPAEGADRLDPEDRLEPVRRHVSPRDPGRPGKRAWRRTWSSTRTPWSSPRPAARGPGRPRPRRRSSRSPR